MPLNTKINIRMKFHRKLYLYRDRYKMHFVTLSIVTVLLLFFIWPSDTTKACYKAKTCIHDAVEKCGVDKSGNPRRFLDTCDLLEYNCYYNGTYVKATIALCSHLPPIEDDEKTNVKT